jgi:hypothetical protein
MLLCSVSWIRIRQDSELTLGGSGSRNRNFESGYGLNFKNWQYYLYDIQIADPDPKQIVLDPQH